MVTDTLGLRQAHHLSGEPDYEHIHLREKQLEWKEQVISILKARKRPIKPKTLARQTKLKLGNVTSWTKKFHMTFVIKYNESASKSGYNGSPQVLSIDLHPDIRKFEEYAASH